MERRRAGRWFAYAAIAVLSVPACDSEDSSEEGEVRILESDKDGQGTRRDGGPAEEWTGRVRIPSNTQAALGEIRIAAGNFWERDYENAEGDTRHGMTCWLWVFFRYTPEQNFKTLAYPGKEFRAGTLRLRVQKLGGKSVTLERIAEP